MSATPSAAWHAAVPKLLPEQVAQANRLRAAGRRAALAWAGRRVALQLRDDAAPPPPPAWQFAIEWPRLRAQVQADALDPLMPGIDDSLAGADEPVRRAIAEQLMSVLAAAMPGLDGATPRVLPCRPGHRTAWRLGFDLRDEDVGSCAAIELGFDTAEAWETVLRLWHRLAQPMPAAGLPMTLRFRIGRTHLPQAAFARLGTGDVILLDRLPTQGGRWQAQLLAGAHRMPWASGVMQGDTIVLQKTEPPAAQAAPPTDRLGVELSFEIGRTTMPLGALTRLAPGYVFELGTTPEGDIVEITTQGRTIGLGRLVLVGDAVGVRVTSLSLDAPPPDAPAPGG